MARIEMKDYLRVEGLTKIFSSTSTKEKGFQGSLRVLVNVNFRAKPAVHHTGGSQGMREDRPFINIMEHVAYASFLKEQV
jgi:hypothetical protein